MPKTAYMQIRISVRKGKKLRKWIDKHDKVEVATGGSRESPNELWLFNETKLAKKRARLSHVE
jgi:hypothetical protein